MRYKGTCRAYLQEQVSGFAVVLLSGDVKGRKSYLALGIVLQEYADHFVVALLHRHSEGCEAILEDIRKYFNFAYQFPIKYIPRKSIKFTSVARLWLAPLLSRSLTTWSWFSCAAMYKGVNPFCDCMLTAAPYWMRILTISDWPAMKERKKSWDSSYVNTITAAPDRLFLLPNEAMCNAVLPFFVAASTLAPLFKSSVTISTWPSFEAKCSAFKPFCNDKRMWCQYRGRENAIIRVELIRIIAELSLVKNDSGTEIMERWQ